MQEVEELYLPLVKPISNKSAEYVLFQILKDIEKLLRYERCEKFREVVSSTHGVLFGVLKEMGETRPASDDGAEVGRGVRSLSTIAADLQRIALIFDKSSKERSVIQQCHVVLGDIAVINNPDAPIGPFGKTRNQKRRAAKKNAARRGERG